MTATIATGIDVETDIKKAFGDKYLEVTKLTTLKKLQKLRGKDRGSAHRLGSGEIPHRRLGTIVAAGFNDGPMSKPTVNYYNKVSA